MWNEIVKDVRNIRTPKCFDLGTGCVCLWKRWCTDAR